MVDDEQQIEQQDVCPRVRLLKTVTDLECSGKVLKCYGSKARALMSQLRVL